MKFCNDLRSLISVRTSTSWSLPTMEDVLGTIAAQCSTTCTNLDMHSEYWQVELDPATAVKTGSKHTKGVHFPEAAFRIMQCGSVNPAHHDEGS